MKEYRFRIVWFGIIEMEVSVRNELGLSLKCSCIYRNEDIGTQATHAKFDTRTTYMDGV